MEGTKSKQTTAMAIKLGKIVKINGALVDLVNKDKENKLLLSSALRLRIRDNIKNIRSACESYQEENNALIAKYGTTILTGEAAGQLGVTEGSENWPAFKTEFEAMLDEEFDVTIKQLTEPELLGAETEAYRLDVATLLSLEDLGILKAS